VIVGIENLSVNRLVPGLVERTQDASPRKVALEPAAGQETFKDLLSNTISSVDGLQNSAAEIQSAFLAGEPVELHQVMIRAEEAGLAMDLLLEVRNKLVAAYSELMRMPV
jgi:flagellar hook-basal body complex protein FliE